MLSSKIKNITYEKLSLISISTLIFSIIFLQTLNFLAPNIPLILITSFPLIFTLLMLNKIKWDFNQVLIYLLLIILAITTAIINHNSNYISYQSLLYLIILYSIFALREQQKDIKYSDFFIKLMMISAGLSILQYLFQLGGLGYWYIGDFIGENALISNYNYLYEYPYASGLYKLNGIYFLEPSFLSQFLALAIIIEFVTHRRLIYLILLTIPLFLSKTGSGILILAMFFLFLLFSDKKYIIRLIPIIVVLIASIVFFGDTIIARSTEITRENTSAFIRFVAPSLNMIQHFMNVPTIHFLFGSGSGTVQDLPLPFVANYTLTIKAIIEYGIIFGILIHLYLLRFIFLNIAKEYRVPLIIFLFVSSGAMLQPVTLYTVWLFQFFHVTRNN